MDRFTSVSYLFDFFRSLKELPLTKSAFVKARNKIKPLFFRHFFTILPRLFINTSPLGDGKGIVFGLPMAPGFEYPMNLATCKVCAILHYQEKLRDVELISVRIRRSNFGFSRVKKIKHSRATVHFFEEESIQKNKSKPGIYYFHVPKVISKRRKYNYQWNRSVGLGCLKRATPSLLLSSIKSWRAKLRQLLIHLIRALESIRKGVKKGRRWRKLRGPDWHFNESNYKLFLELIIP